MNKKTTERFIIGLKQGLVLSLFAADNELSPWPYHLSNRYTLESSTHIDSSKTTLQ